VTLAENHRRLLDQYSAIDDPQERLAAVVDRARRRPPLPPHERTEAQRIRGCVSAAWLVAELEDGRCRFRTDADSPIVRGLLALLADLHSGATPTEIAAAEASLLDDLGLSQSLSPTRLNGLRAAMQAIREFARQHQ
jgi:cysteine desulfuration protein SufE